MEDSLYENTEDIEAYGDVEDSGYDMEYRHSVKWDPVTGDFVRDGANRMVSCSGREAYMIWCLKMVVTSRDAHLAYIDEFAGCDLGVDIDEALAMATRASVETEVERTITEALETNPRTEWVGNFFHEWDGDDLHTAFTVKGVNWEDEITIFT